MIQEYIPLGQRIKSFAVEILSSGKWKMVYQGSTIGNKRLVRFETQTVEAVRFKVNESKAQVVLSNAGLYRAPEIND